MRRLILLLIALAPACASDSTISEEIAQRREDGEERGRLLAEAMRVELLTEPSGPAIFGKVAATVLEIDAAAIEQADLAVDRAESTQARALGARIARDHKDIDVRVEALIEARAAELQYGDVTDVLAAEAEDVYGMLVSARGGASWDREYTLIQVTVRAETLVLLDEIDRHLRDPDVRGVVGDLRAATDRHLTAAIGTAEQLDELY